jgi:hypothetical protein
MVTGNSHFHRFAIKEQLDVRGDSLALAMSACRRRELEVKMWSPSGMPPLSDWTLKRLSAT